MSETELELDLEELSSAEDFLEYFKVSFDPSVVQVNRLHILQRLHDYLADSDDMPADEVEMRRVYKALLTQAYNDFVASDARTEKVFKVFRRNDPVMVPLSSLTTKVSAGAPKV